MNCRKDIAKENRLIIKLFGIQHSSIRGVPRCPIYLPLIAHLQQYPEVVQKHHCIVPRCLHFTLLYYVIHSRNKIQHEITILMNLIVQLIN